MRGCVYFSVGFQALHTPHPQAQQHRTISKIIQMSLLSMLNSYFKTSMIDFVQQLINTCAYIDINKASYIQTMLAKSLWNDTYKATVLIYIVGFCTKWCLLPLPRFNVDL